MAYVWKHPKSPFWTGIYRDDQNQWRKKSTKKTAKSAAFAVAVEWERAAGMGRDRILTEAISREVIGGILERTSGETLRQSTVREFCAEWMLSKTKLVTLKEGHCLKHAQNWACRKRSFLGIPVPVLGRK